MNVTKRGNGLQKKYRKSFATMQTNDDFMLAPRPADPTTASTGAEADNRDKVSAADAVGPHIAPQSREHAHERVYLRNTYAMRVYYYWPRQRATSVLIIGVGVSEILDSRISRDSRNIPESGIRFSVYGSQFSVFSF